jgi:hypothetical protein
LYHNHHGKRSDLTAERKQEFVAKAKEDIAKIEDPTERQSATLQLEKEMPSMNLVMNTTVQIDASATALAMLEGHRELFD